MLVSYINYHHFIFILLLSSFTSSQSNKTCNEVDSKALLSFSHNISAIPPLNWSLSGLDCCQWEGISCNQDGRVTHLSLPLKGLKGRISPSLGNLTYLTHLNLSNNHIWGTTGVLTTLDQLEILDVSSNDLNGHFEISSLSLTMLNISNNIFSGIIPISSICLNSKLLACLDLSCNNFEGEIPTGLANCSKLEVFRAGNNNLSGSLPDDLYDVISLQEISLPGNRISGIIRGDRIVRLANLTILELCRNELSGVIPLEIGNLTKLRSLTIYSNNLAGSLPSSIRNCLNLESLNLRKNSLDGDISAIDFSSLVKLSTIDLGENNLTGILPESLFSCKSLTAVRLSKNLFYGQVPPNLGTLQFLSYVSFSQNKLTNITSAFQILMGCKNLTAMILARNFNGEKIPDEGIAELKRFQKLRVLALGGCELTGRLPSWLTTLTKLEALDLSTNQLTGTIPGWLGVLPRLFYIDLSDNYFSGEIPVQLTSSPILVLVNATAQLDQSYLELPVFVKSNNASRLQYNQLSDLPPALYLRNNSLNGAIPPEIGRLQFLHVLDLSHNNLSGNIPDQLSNLTNLEALDLSGNYLSGEIPLSLKRLNFLSSFKVANNNLTGQIPSGNQFDTFPYSSFNGNPGLCGGPFVKEHPCGNQTSNPSIPKPKKHLNKKLTIGLILGICFGIGFVLTTVTLWMLSKRRINPRGGEAEDSNEKNDMDMSSFNSNREIPSEVILKESNLVMLFPGSNNEFKNLTISEILKATDNFDQENIIGCGGFGLVFKAALANGTILAVKKLSGDMGLMEREFKAEVEALSNAQHKNLVSLQGYYVHGRFRLLIYTYMENGSLDYWLHEMAENGSQLDWPTRLRIAQGASRGLSYIHQICEPHIIHRDIKSSNILLDDEFEARVADFGLARLIDPYETHVTTELVGTLGYIPPEYGQAWVATLRGDIYSFGVVILELLTGKRPVEIFKPKMSRELVGWVQHMRLEGKKDEVFDPLIMGKGCEEEMVQVLDVACLCVNQDPFKRPTINEVVNWLESVTSQPAETKHDKQI
ncbi:hypothetical protein GIB67_026422 [Kingdonia uniflora]|uniref:non-specific serine/threonine protein kinase n=1 Tax=Kingdonia uniflora TaxID=39325 RepID=A0A7J7P718_9MAGN|nr:hypothetical protein GIB67_026422 [Kingdonia uniflora]